MVRMQLGSLQAEKIEWLIVQRTPVSGCTYGGVSMKLGSDDSSREVGVKSGTIARLQAEHA
jgi:hypothetical protein